MYMANSKQHHSQIPATLHRTESAGGKQEDPGPEQMLQYHRNVCNAAVLFKFLACATVFFLQ